MKYHVSGLVITIERNAVFDPAYSYLEGPHPLAGRKFTRVTTNDGYSTTVRYYDTTTGKREYSDWYDLYGDCGCSDDAL